MRAKKQRDALFLEIHKLIEQAAVDAVEGLATSNSRLTYPPNGGLTEEEQTEVARLDLNPILKIALRKIIADAASVPIFHLFCLIDGVADPEGYDGLWLGYRLVLPSKGEPAPSSRLHDEFFETYWKWRRTRQDAGWRLDNLEDQ
jgi:hypothetical protein